MVHFDSISLRTKFKEKKNHEYQSLETKSLKSHCTKHKMMKHCPRFILCTVKTTDSHFVPIPTLRRDNSEIEPCQVGIPTSPDKVRIPTLSGTILELSRFLLRAEHIYIKESFSLLIIFYPNFEHFNFTLYGHRISSCFNI